MSRFGCWIAYHVVTKWPGCVENRGLGRVWWWLLPWAGRHAYSDRPDVQS